ncbi:retrotransposon protein, putative, ty1-copia subclass [Tanacetum coccineum]
MVLATSYIPTDAYIRLMITPPYTPQHNGVSERRNRTLLDMVRSMMNLTTLPLSFWDYALESATHILNMVPTKMVDKTPYELCNNSMEVEGFEPPQEEDISIRRSERTRQAPNRLSLNVETEEHSLGDLNVPTSYKAVMLDSESNNWKVDYKETFSPVADIRAIRILISIAAYYDYEIWKMDIKIAFLNGYLDEDIYMVQPEGFVDPNHPRKVCKLQRSIYGLKQASRSWNKRFDEEIKRFGFSQNLDEPCVYQKASGSNVKRHLFLESKSIEIDRSKLSQNAYMDKILKRYKMDNSKRVTIPMQERLDLNKSQGAQTPKENPDELHWTVVKNILKYLRNTKDMFLVYGGNPSTELRVECYCNAGFETDIDDTKSLTGYVSF